MKRVTFIFPKMRWKFEKTPYPPLGIGYLGAVLRRQDWEVSVIDGQILDSQEYQSRIENINDEVVGISASIKQIEEALRIADLLKKGIPLFQ